MNLHARRFSGSNLWEPKRPGSIVQANHFGVMQVHNLATLKPTTLLAIFNTPQLEGVAQEVEDTIVKIMKEAAAGSS